MEGSKRSKQSTLKRGAKSREYKKREEDSSKSLTSSSDSRSYALDRLESSSGSAREDKQLNAASLNPSQLYSNQSVPQDSSRRTERGQSCASPEMHYPQFFPLPSERTDALATSPTEEASYFADFTYPAYSYPSSYENQTAHLGLDHYLDMQPHGQPEGIRDRSIDPASGTVSSCDSILDVMDQASRRASEAWNETTLKASSSADEVSALNLSGLEQVEQNRLAWLVVTESRQLRNADVPPKNMRKSIPEGHTLKKIEELIQKCTEHEVLRELKKEQRTLKNRISAQTSRQRKKNQMTAFSKDNEELIRLNNHLSIDNANLKKQNQDLKVQLQTATDRLLQLNTERRILHQQLHRDSSGGFILDPSSHFNQDSQGNSLEGVNPLFAFAHGS